MKEIVILIFLPVALTLIFLPTIIAFRRRLRYRWKAFGLNILGLPLFLAPLNGHIAVVMITASLWIAILIWSVWPRRELAPRQLAVESESTD